jgi:oligopeptide/dipeptide ABC transporter ATP-binding protein
MAAPREPFVVLRDFRVWFEKRAAFLAALSGGKQEYVRAVDGINLDIGKGEIYCLVGESGCGKTTTGMGILQLVEPTGGDVFVGVPPETLGAYKAAKAKRDEVALDDLRRRHSLTYREKIEWGPRDTALFAVMAALGGLVGAFVAAGTGVALDGLGATGWEFIGGILLGLLVGLFGTLPFLKRHRRIPVVLACVGALAALPALFLWPYLQGLLYPPPGALGDYVIAKLQGALITAALEPVLAVVAAWETARVMTDVWSRRQGVLTSRMRMKGLRRSLQIIFQDPYESLNPRQTVYDIVAEPLQVNRITRGRAETADRVQRALNDAGLRPPQDFLIRYPHELSGGQRQRLSIAATLVLDPDFIVADEPVSMLDVSIRTEIIELLLELRKEKGLTYLFITHDLSLAWVLADRIGVMYLGKIVEEGPTREVIRNPHHPYTKALISVVPIPHPQKRHKRLILQGERPDPSDIPPGCRFHPRCPVAIEQCGWTSDEVLDALKGLAGDGPMAKPLRAVKLDTRHSFVLPPDSADLEAWIREEKAAASESTRALKALWGIKGPAGSRRVILHNYKQPALRRVESGVKVACHLFETPSGGPAPAIAPSPASPPPGTPAMDVAAPSGPSAS